jgi:DNA polymerase-3 subunit alpha
LAVHLCAHSDYSLLESVLTVEGLVKQGAKLGFTALALTDHNSTGGHWEFQRYCREEGIKPIFGLELDVNYDSDSQPRQVVVLALDNGGYGSLLRLASLPPPVPREALAQFKQGLALLEGGRTGQLTAHVAQGHLDQAQALYKWYGEQFGGDFFLRREAGEKTGLERTFPQARFVLCQDVRYAQRASAQTLRILAAIKGSEVNVPPYPMLSWEEICRQAGGSREMVANTLELAQRCSVELPSERGMRSQEGSTRLEELAWQGAAERFGEPDPQVRTRLQYELQVISELGFADYFLTVADLVRFAKGAGIPVGPGRGSAAGSLTAYVLGITEVNPLEWGLVFERFLNPERRSKPDIDVDFCFERRGEVLAYAVQRFGQGHVAQIGTYGTFGPKSAVQEVRRVLGRDNPKAAAEIQNLKRHRSTHAAGIIVSHRPIEEFSAVYRDRSIPVTHLDMYALEDLGALKIDLLGLRTLTLLRNMEQEVQRRGPSFSLEGIPLHDEKTLELLGQGRTTGVFQLESELFQDLLKQLKPASFTDIVALLALGRPGPLSMFGEFAARRRDPSRISYLHPELEEILGETYGLILYQEQVMAIAHRLGGLSLGEADLLRRDLAKGGADAERWRERFVQGAQGRGLGREAAQKLFSSIAQFSGYAFNKAHSVSYALLSWRAAYLKTHYPEVFYTVLLNQGSPGKGQSALLAEAKTLGVEILPPSVLHSQARITLEGKAIRLGLTTNRKVPPYSAQEIVEKRGAKLWASFAQFRAAVNLDHKLLETLVLMGALDDLGERHQHLGELGLPARSALELVKAEKELLGVYVSLHPCGPFWPLAERLRGELDAAVGEVIELEMRGKRCQGVLDTPGGYLAFQGQLDFPRGWLKSGARIAVFGLLQGTSLVLEWALPLVPTLLITPKPQDLEIIKGILGGERGARPAILLIGQAYHVLPPEFWVGSVGTVNHSLEAAGVVYTWFDPWKENA